MRSLFRAILNFTKDCVPVISLVDEPAIELDFQYFSKSGNDVFSSEVFESFRSVDEMQCKIAGPILVPDKRIFRIDRNTREEYDLFFDADTVQAMADNFSQNQNNRNITIQHSGVRVPVTITESWITGKPDKSDAYGYDLPEGTWFCVAKVEDREFFEKYVMTGIVKGFSIETPIKEKQLIKMNLEKFSAFPIKDSEKPLEAEVLEVGQDATIDGQPANGEFKLEDGTTVTAVEGKITDVKLAEAEAEVEKAEEAPAAEAPAAPAVDPAQIAEMVNQIVDQKMALVEERILKIEDALRAAQSKSEEAMSKVEEFGKTTPAAPSMTKQMTNQLSAIEAYRKR